MSKYMNIHNDKKSNFWGFLCNTASIYLGGCNAVDKADLLEAFFTQGYRHLPALIGRLMNHRQWLSIIICFVFHIQVDVIFEIFYLSSKNHSILGMGRSTDVLWCIYFDRYIYH